MGRFRVIIEKETSFQGRTERWSNVYVLDTGIAESFNDEAAIDGIVALEKAVHGGQVAFKRGESYGINPVTGDNPRFGKDLTGNGTAAVQYNCYPELAILVKWELPRVGGMTGIGKRRMLRKWLHTGALSGTGATTTMAEGRAAFATTVKDFYRTTYAEPLRTGDFGGGKLSAPNGDYPAGSAVHDYMEHRQFHAGKKRPSGLLS